MVISVKHKFVSNKADSADASIIRPSNWNDVHEITLAGQRLLGKSTANNGAAEEITLSTGLEFAAGALRAKIAEIITSANMQTGLGYVPASKSGDTFTGPISLQAVSPELRFEDTTSGETDCRFRLEGNILYIERTADFLTYVEVARINLTTKVMYINDLDVRTGTVGLDKGGTGATSLADAKTTLGIGALASASFADIFPKWNIVSRTTNVVYQNTLGKWMPIMVASPGGVYLYVSQSLDFAVPFVFGSGDHDVFSIIPPDWYYKIPNSSISVLEARV